MNRLEKREYGAYTIRPKIKKMLPEYLKPMPETDGEARLDEPTAIEFHTEVTAREYCGAGSVLRDRSFGAAIDFVCGWPDAKRSGILDYFLEDNLRRYAGGRNEPSRHATSN